MCFRVPASGYTYLCFCISKLSKLVIFIIKNTLPVFGVIVKGWILSREFLKLTFEPLSHWNSNHFNTNIELAKI